MLYCIALHCIALHCNALHCIVYRGTTCMHPDDRVIRTGPASLYVFCYFSATSHSSVHII